MQKFDISRIREGWIGFNFHSYPVRVIRTNRKTYGITITPSMEVIFRLPETASEDDLDSFARRKRKWISQQLSFFEQFQPNTKPRQFISGETHLFLGSEYRLRLVAATKWNIVLTRLYIIVYTPEKAHSDKIRKHLEIWYRKQAEIIFRERHEALQKQFEKKIGSWMMPPTIRKLKSKWGAYDPTTRTYTLNTDLVKAPLESIDYVILHENCHLVHPNHDQKFYHLLSRLTPGWEKSKLNLEKSLS